MLVNDALVFTVQATNAAGYGLPDLTVTDQLPTGFEVEDITVSQGQATQTGESVLLVPGLVPAGSGITLTVSGRARAVGVITNSVRLASSYLAPLDPALHSVLTVSVVEQPPIYLVRDGTRLVLSWPTLAGAGFVLESSPVLGSQAVWVRDPSPVVVEDGRQTVTIKIVNGDKFYRLRQETP